ncbi:MAG: hypothetical protein FWF56_05155 [Firmicutes bacterium]|nr:hypothetical protein [Bacillota bacterium]
MIDNVKQDRTTVDLLFQTMLEIGITLDAHIDIRQIQNKTVYFVNDNQLIATFDDNITESVVTEIAKAKPLFAVFKNTSMSTDSVGVNFDQIFYRYHPDMSKEDRRFI